VGKHQILEGGNNGSVQRTTVKIATNCWKTTTKINGEDSSRNSGAFDRLPVGTDGEKLGGVVKKSTAPGAGCNDGEFLSIRPPQQ